MSILNFCRTEPPDSTIVMLRRIERALSPKRWPQTDELELLLALPTQFSRILQYSLPAQRVIAAALQTESRTAHISRIRSLVVADAVDTYINDHGSVRSNLQLALERLAGGLHSKHLNSLKSWRKAGEWLIDFFQRIPLGAIYMMDRQTTPWGNLIGKGYIAPIVEYCQSLPEFIGHAEKLTPGACQAIRGWASACAYHLKPDSSLGQLVEEQEKCHYSMGMLEPMSYASISSQVSSEISYNETEEVLKPGTLATTTVVPPNRYGYTVNQESSSGVRNLVRIEEQKTSSRALINGDVDMSSAISSSPERTTETVATRERGGELLFMASRAASTPTMPFHQGPRAGTSPRGYAEPSRVSRSPSSPQALLIPENLLRDITVYFEGSCRKMLFNDHEILLTSEGTEFRNDLCTDFDSYCFTATMLKGKGLPIESCRALSKASALVKDILQAEHPRTLACFFEVLIHLIQSGLPEMAFTLRRFIKGMSEVIGREENLWSRICRLLGELEPVSLIQTLAQAWKCVTDVFDSELGTCNRLAVSVRLDYIKRVITNQSEEERLLRDVLAQFGVNHTHSTPRVMLNLAQNLNRQGRHHEAEKIALRVLWMLEQHGIYSGRNSERIESLKVLSYSQFLQGKVFEAERTMREAIRVIMDLWGQGHSWALEFINVLEGWLRVWGRNEDANALRGDLEDLIAQDLV